MGVSRLGYIGLAVHELEMVKTIFTKVLGMELREASDDGAVSLRMDGRQQRITLLPAKEDRLAYVGWEVDTRQALMDVVENVKLTGVSVTVGNEAEKAKRGVLELYHFAGPDGVQTELYFGGAVDGEPFKSPRAHSGFLTGDQGLGHILLGASDPEAALRFYGEVLGFSVSDYIYWNGCEATFMHCNSRHHSLAVMNPSFGTEAGALNHVVVEANDIDDIGRAYDILRDLQIPVVLTLGKHSNDFMTSFYIQTPGGWAIEYGFGAREIDDQWVVKYYTSPRLWGHHLVAPPAPPQ